MPQAIAYAMIDYSLEAIGLVLALLERGCVAAMLPPDGDEDAMLGTFVVTSTGRSHEEGALRDESSFEHLGAT